jgi:uncharacterized protein (TIGR03086 family)
VSDLADQYRAVDAVLRAARVADASAVADTPFGEQRLDQAIGMIVTGDVLVHQWDLARATGGDERLDPEAVHRLFDGMEAMDESMRSSGHFGPRVDVPADASEQDRLLAFTGRDPGHTGM